MVEPVSQGPAALATDPVQGLSSAEVAARVQAGQINAVAWTTSRSLGRIVFENAASPINVVLFAISGALLALGLYGDAFLTGGLVLGNVLVGVFQETRAKRQLDRVALLNRPMAIVVRDGSEKEIPPDQVVLGDYLVLRPGDQVIVDGRLLEASGLGVDESLLTGESDILPKRAGDDLVSGSYCMAGSGLYEATRVGAETMANSLTARAREHRLPRTPLQREVGLVLWAMSIVVLFLGVLVARSFADGEDVPVEEAVRAAAVIVALVPQGLAVMVTVSYAMAAVRMAGSGVLIQRMNAVESISHVDILCLDKTGTLTTNRLIVEEAMPLVGSAVDFEVLLGSFAASASFRNRTADAIHDAFPAAEIPVSDEVAFDSARKWSGLVFAGNSMPGAIVLGAPDVITEGTDAQVAVLSKAETWTSRGLRVLLLAMSKTAPRFHQVDGQPILPDGLEPLGLIVLRDETRTDAASVIKEFAEAGIGLKVISGDHPETVAALAGQAGLPMDGAPVNGGEIETIDDEALEALARNGRVFGRVSPGTKERIVSALRRGGSYVAMIGDGVNDVPALKASHVAVAMRSGSAITRDISDMVLLNDAFSNLPRAFREGQRIRRGMEDIFRVFLSRTVSLAVVILVVALVNDPFPVTPRHTALISALTVGIPSLFLAAWSRPGRTGETVIISGSRFVIPAALSIAAASLAVYEGFLSVGGDVGVARTALTFTATGCGLLIILFLDPPRSFSGAAGGTADRRPILMAGSMFCLLLTSAAVPFLRDFFELELPGAVGFFVIGSTVIAWALVMRIAWQKGLLRSR
jgi:cation-transporting ATPase E